MQDIYIVEAARSPIGKRGKGLAGLLPADLLGKVQRGALERAGVDPANVGQIIGGCVPDQSAIVQYRPDRLAFSGFSGGSGCDDG